MIIIQDDSIEQIIKLNDWMCENEPNYYHLEANTADSLIALLEHYRRIIQPTKPMQTEATE